MPCEPPANCTDESLRRHHYVNYLVRQFAFCPNPIDDEELKSMQKRLSVAQGEMWLDAQPINNWEQFQEKRIQENLFQEVERVSHPRK